MESYIPYQTQYYKILTDLLYHYDKKIDSRVGKARSNFVRQLRVNLQKEFPLMDIKQTSFANIVHELLWFLSGNTNIKYLVDNKCFIWNDDAFRWYNDRMVPLGAPQLSKEEFIQRVKKEEIIDNPSIMDQLSAYELSYKYGDLGTVYGHQWRNFGYQIDQVAKVIETLKTNPDTRQDLIITGWNPEDKESGLMALPPCHNYIQFYTEPGILGQRRNISLYFNMRSCDFFLGNPYNVPSYSILLMMVAQLVGMTPKTVVCNMVDCHLYEAHIDAANEWLIRYETRGNEQMYSMDETLNDIFGGKSKINIDSSVKNIDDFKFEHFKLSNYKSEGKINAPLLT